MNAIDLVDAALPHCATPTDSQRFAVKALLLATLLPPDADLRWPVPGHGRVTAATISDDDCEPLWGPIACGKLDFAWRRSHALVDGALQIATGYTLAELTSLAAIERCMALTGPTAHPALYPALMKLWRLQHDVEAQDTTDTINQGDTR